MNKITKNIKKSKRGLTFSFNGINTKFNIGDNYKYVIDKKNNKIFIIPEKIGLKISKKKCGTRIKSLIDLRAKKVVESFEKADFINVIIQKDIIVVKGLIKVNKVFKEVDTFSITKDIVNKIAEQCGFYQLNLFNEFLNKQSFIDNESINNLDKVIKVFSIFSGIGMLDKPFSEDKAFKIVKAVEIDPKACMSYKENIGDVVINEDIRNIEKKDIPFADILLGGTSCKSYSKANRRCRLEAHKDSDLLSYYIDIAKMGNFKAFVLENVVELVTLKKGYYYSLLKDELKEYDIECFILKDNECGGFTKRKRVIIIGSKIGKPKFDIKIKKAGTVEEALSKVDSSWYNFKDLTKSSQGAIERMKFIPEGGNWMNIPKELWQPSYSIGKTHSNTFRRLKRNEPSVTLANFRKCNLLHPTENRGLSVAEALALSGFNKDFKVLGNLSDKQMGVANGITYRMATTIKEWIKALFIKNVPIGV